MRDCQYKVSRPTGYGLRTERAADGEVWYAGYVSTPFGFVSVYSEERITTLSIIIEGVEHTRQFERGFKRSYLVTLAYRFGAEVSA